MSAWWGRCPLEALAMVVFFGQMLSTILSWEVIVGTSLCVDWWCTSRETAERPLQARSSKQPNEYLPVPVPWPAHPSHGAGAAPTYLGKLESRPSLGPFCLPFATWLWASLLFCSWWSIFCRRVQWLLLECVVSKFQCCLSVIINILYQWHDWGNE